MSVHRDLEAARQALDDLLTDERELATLEAALQAELDGLKAGGSRDFAELATLEGKRAAAHSLLTEQRRSVAQARQNVTDLEQQAERTQQLEALRPRIEALGDFQRQAAQELAELQMTVCESLSRLQATRQAWATAREQVAADAARLFGLRDPALLELGNDSQSHAARARWTAAASELGPDALGILQALPFSTDTAGRVRYPSGQPFDGPQVSPHEVMTARQVTLGELLDGPTRQAVYAGLRQALDTRPQAFEVRKW